MAIRQLSLTDFRNLKSTTLEFDPRFNLVSGGKNSDAQSIYLIKFPALPDNKKELNNWQRKQQQALEFLKDDGKQISIDIMDLESFSEFQIEIEEN